MTEPPSWSAPGGEDAGATPGPGLPPPPPSPPGQPPLPQYGAPQYGAPQYGYPAAYPGGFAAPYAMAAPKPGIIPLRPLTVGEILDGAFSTIRRHPRATLGLSAAVACGQQLLILLWRLASGTLTDSSNGFFSPRTTTSDGSGAFTAGDLTPLIGVFVILIITAVLGALLTGVL